MELITYTDSHAFYQRAEPFLLAHEAEHNLPLGICSTILAEASKPEEERQYPRPFMGIIDEQGEVVAVALRTPPHHLILSLIPRNELADGALSLLLDHLSVRQPDLTGVVGATALSKAFADQWQQRTGHAHHLRDHERIYRLETVQPVSGVAGSMRKATRNDRDLLASWYAAFMAEALPTEILVQTAEKWADRLFQTNYREAYLWEDQGEPSAGWGRAETHPTARALGQSIRRHRYEAEAMPAPAPPPSASSCWIAGNAFVSSSPISPTLLLTISTSKSATNQLLM